MNSVKFFVTLAVLAACIFAVFAEPGNQNNNQGQRDKRFPFFGGLGYSAYPYAAAGYGVGYGGYGFGYGAYPYAASIYHY